MSADEWHFKTPSFNTLGPEPINADYGYTFVPLGGLDKFVNPWKVLWKGTMKVSAPKFHSQIYGFTGGDEAVTESQPEFINGQGEW